MKKDYVRTTQLYRIIFESGPPLEIWPDVMQRFDEVELYSSQLFNVREYIESRMVGKRGSNQGRAEFKRETVLLINGKRSMAHMLASSFPEKGTGHVQRVSPSLEFYKEMESYPT